MKRLYQFKFIRYATVGAFAAGIKFSFFSTLYAVGMNYHLAATIAYVLSAIFHFTANRHFTFRSRSGRLSYQASKYLILTLLNYTITMTVITFCIEHLALNAYFSMIIAIAANTATNYLISKFWVFKIKKHAV